MGEAKRRKTLEPNWGKATAPPTGWSFSAIKSKDWIDDLIAGLKNKGQWQLYKNADREIVEESDIAYIFSKGDSIAACFPCLCHDLKGAEKNCVTIALVNPGSPRPTQQDIKGFNRLIWELHQ
ncbi:hypothetical protein [Floridanema evergladense]|uniref:Uncharacterized protein n=1 Tax=Floridaenema evergladense BLCC-F167 TaxID=3153639 RepID=A0ABV4WMX2_9CYAN